MKKHKNVECVCDPELEEKIIECLRLCPGMRKRTIAYECRVSVYDLIPLLYQMCDMGKLYYKVHHDFANMEHYEQYYVKE